MSASRISLYPQSCRYGHFYLLRRVSISSNASHHDISERQRALYDEASSITRALYKRCLKSIKVLAKGNEHDEIEFAAREDSELSQFENNNNNTPLSSGSLLSPPVNRANELSSRANYYTGFCRENFEGHWNLLGVHGFHIDKNIHGMGHNIKRNASHDQHTGGNIDEYNLDHVWNEDQVKQFVYLIRSGEEKRTWILHDYEFVDPCIENEWPKELESRLEKFQEDANSLVKDMYQAKGWVHSSELEMLTADIEDDSDDEEDL